MKNKHSEDSQITMDNKCVIFTLSHIGEKGQTVPSECKLINRYTFVIRKGNFQNLLRGTFLISPNKEFQAK